MFAAPEKGVRIKTGEEMTEYEVQPVTLEEQARLPLTRRVGLERDRVLPLQEPFLLGSLTQEGDQVFFAVGGANREEGHRFCLQKTQGRMFLGCLDLPESVKNHTVLMPPREKVEVIIGRRPGNEVAYAGAPGQQPADRADTVILIYGLGDEVKGRRRDFTDVSRINFDPETRQVVGGHARIIIKGDEVFIRDEGSSNGTWVNKEGGVSGKEPLEKGKEEKESELREVLLQLAAMVGGRVELDEGEFISLFKILWNSYAERTKREEKLTANQFKIVDELVKFAMARGIEIS